MERLREYLAQIVPISKETQDKAQRRTKDLLMPYLALGQLMAMV